MRSSSLCDYINAYTLAKGTITVPDTAAEGPAVNYNNKKVVFKNVAPFTSCITELNNTQEDNVEDIDLVITMHNLIEYSNAYSETSGGLWQYYRVELALNNNCNIIDNTNGNTNGNNSISFNFN